MTSSKKRMHQTMGTVTPNGPGYKFDWYAPTRKVAVVLTNDGQGTWVEMDANQFSRYVEAAHRALGNFDNRPEGWTESSALVVASQMDDAYEARDFIKAFVHGDWAEIRQEFAVEARKLDKIAASKL